MERYYVFIVFSLILISCSKKEVKEDVKVVAPAIIKVEDSNTEPLEKVKYESKIIFTVQVAALINKNSTLTNLKGVQIFEEGGLTKYRLGTFSTYKEAKSFKATIYKVYPGAFIQALKDNVPINIEEALK